MRSKHRINVVTMLYLCSYLSKRPVPKKTLALTLQHHDWACLSRTCRHLDLSGQSDPCFLHKMLSIAFAKPMS